MVKAAFQAKMKALEESGLNESVRGAREKALQQAFVTLFSPAGKARYDKQLASALAMRPVPPPKAKPMSFFVMVLGLGLVAAALAGGWYVTHPSGERLEQQRKEAAARKKGRSPIPNFTPNRETKKQ
jgi:hypothetical protein